METISYGDAPAVTRIMPGGPETPDSQQSTRAVGKDCFRVCLEQAEDADIVHHPQNSFTSPVKEVPPRRSGARDQSSSRSHSVPYSDNEDSGRGRGPLLDMTMLKTIELAGSTVPDPTAVSEVPDLLTL